MDPCLGDGLGKNEYHIFFLLSEEEEDADERSRAR